MDKRFDIGEFVPVVTEQSVRTDLVKRVKLRRKELKLSQKELAARTGVSYGSVRRFEVTGEISLCSLIKIAHALNSLEDFNELFKGKKLKSLKDYKG